jgi:hypothetical protein
MQGRSSEADPRFTFHASRFTVLGSEARTQLADFFSILLDGVMGGDEEGSQVPEPLKVWPTAFFKLVGQVIQVGDTIFDDGEPLGIKSLSTIEEIHHASADHGIQCH